MQHHLEHKGPGTALQGFLKSRSSFQSKFHLALVQLQIKNQRDQFNIPYSASFPFPTSTHIQLPTLGKHPSNVCHKKLSGQDPFQPLQAPGADGRALKVELSFRRCPLMVQLVHFHSSPYLVVARVVGQHVSKVLKSLLVIPSLAKEVHKHQKFRNKGS